MWPFGQSRGQVQQILPDEEIESQLNRLCNPHGTGLVSQSSRIPEHTIQSIRIYLRCLDYKAERNNELKWSLRPRLYGILRNIGALDFMDTFIREYMSDFHLPYTQQSLPTFFGRSKDTNLRQRFLDAQEFYLTNVKDIEDGDSPGTHYILKGTGDHYFVPMKPLGHGSFGGVDLVFSRLSIQKYARKRVLRGRDSERNREAQQFLITELKALKRLDYRHLVKIIGSYSDREYIAYLMTPVAEITLEQFLSSLHAQRADLKDVLRQFFGCLAGAIHYLHQRKIRHRDLTARNILIYRGEVFISDFGSAYSWAHKQSSMTRHRNTPVSPDYMAPEISKDEERGCASDMWSLGVVFLEMTTTLLGFQVKQLKGSIQANAARTKTQPYAYANLPAVIDWLERLSKTELQFEYDKEPLTWIRDLLQSRPDNRPSSAILMKDILETPSFGLFCCFKCQPNFRDGGFAYDAALPKSEPEEDSRGTRDTVAALFHYSDTSAPFGGMTTERTNSIKDWLVSGNYSETGSAGGIPELSGEPLEVEVGEFNDMDAQELLYGAYEHEFYNPVEPGVDPETFILDSEPMVPPSLTEAVEMSGDYTWAEKAPDKVDDTVKYGTNHKDLIDTGLGFMEYESCSSDDGQTQPLFEEVSDRSSIASADGEQTATISTHLQWIMEEEDYDQEDTNEGDSHVQEGKLFVEGSHKSDYNDVSVMQDRQNDDDKQGNTRIGGTITGSPNANIVLDYPTEGGAVSEGIKHSHCEIEDVTMSEKAARSSTSFDCPSKHTIIDSVTIDILDGKAASGSAQSHPESSTLQEIRVENKKDIRKSEEVLLLQMPQEAIDIVTEDSVNKQADIVENKFQPSAVMATDVAEDEIPKAFHFEKENNTHVSVPGMPRRAAIEVPSVGLAIKSPQDPPLPEVEPKKPKRVRIAVENDSSRDALTDMVAEKECDIPQIVIEPFSKSHGAVPLSRANVKNASQTSKSARAPRKREALLEVDPAKFLKDTWEKASSTPSSKISEKSRSSLTKLLLFTRSDADFAFLLTNLCEKGNSSKVRYLLQNDSRAKAKKRHLRSSLLAAVRGGTARHTKCARELVAAGAEVNTVYNKIGKTPLHIAIEHGNFRGYVNLIGFLISQGADTNVCDRDGDYPLMKLFFGRDSLPLEKHRREALALLLWKDTNLNITQPGTGNTPLHLAVRRQDKFPVAMLLSKNADVNAKNSSGITPLQMTANQFRGDLSPDHAQVLDLLLHYKASVDEKAGALRRTALHWAVNSGTAQAVEMLLRYKASPTIKDKDGQDAITLAIKNAEKLTTDTNKSESDRLDDHVEIMAQLNQAAGCNWPMNTRKCVIEVACRDTDTTLLRFCLKKGLDPNATFKTGTVKDFADNHGSVEALGLLSQ